MKAGSFFLQVIALARIRGNRGSLGALSRAQRPLSLPLSRSAGTGRRCLLLTSALLSLLIQILQLRQEPTPPAHELPFLRTQRRARYSLSNPSRAYRKFTLVLDFVGNCNFN
jgi:hypothetical protein